MVRSPIWQFLPQTFSGSFFVHFHFCNNGIVQFAVGIGTMLYNRLAGEHTDCRFKAKPQGRCNNKAVRQFSYLLFGVCCFLRSYLEYDALVAERPPAGKTWPGTIGGRDRNPWGPDAYLDGAPGWSDFFSAVLVVWGSLSSRATRSRVAT